METGFIIAYLLDAQGVHIGTQSIDPMARLPEHFTLVQPPTIEDGQFAVWNGRAWLVLEKAPPTDIENLKAAANASINTWRAAANLSTFPHAGKLIACDTLSRSDIDGVANNIALFGTFPVGFPGGWKATDNTMIALADVDAFRAMYASMTAQGTRNFNRSQELKAELEVASTPEEIAALAW